MPLKKIGWDSRSGQGRSASAEGSEREEKNHCLLPQGLSWSSGRVKIKLVFVSDFRTVMRNIEERKESPRGK